MEVLCQLSGEDAVLRDGGPGPIDDLMACLLGADCVVVMEEEEAVVAGTAGLVLELLVPALSDSTRVRQDWALTGLTRS